MKQQVSERARSRNKALSRLKLLIKIAKMLYSVVRLFEDIFDKL